MLSIAVFGSIARKDGDYLSDRDVLIVSDDLMRLQRHRCRWEASGWSVAGYSWAKLNNIADKDGLFIKHLRDEARIVYDEKQALADCLRSFIPKKDYDLEIEDNLALFDLLRLMPNSGLGRLWAADILAVAFRNHGILRLANEGIYVYGFEKILRELARLSAISQRTKQRLATLRYYKHCYRRGRHETYIDDLQLQMWKSALTEILLREIDFGTDAIDQSVERIEWNKISRYGALRLAEGELIRIRLPLLKTGSPELRRAIERLESVIASPRDLLSESENDLSLIWTEVDRLKSICAASVAHKCPSAVAPITCFIPAAILDYPNPNGALVEMHN